MKARKFLSAVFIIISFFIFLGIPKLSAQDEPVSSSFKVKFGRDGIVSLKYTPDKYDTEYIALYETLGHVTIRYKMGENEWREFSTRDPENKYRRFSNTPSDP